MKRLFWILFVFFLGAGAGVMGIYLKSGVEYWWRVPAPSSAAIARPMVERTVNPEIIRSGEPKVRSSVFSATTGGSAIGGIWECEGPAEVVFFFGSDERLWVVEGRVEVDYLDNRFTLGPGDTALFRAGTTATWNIPVKLKKVWVVHDPGRAVRAMSFLADLRK